MFETITNFEYKEFVVFRDNWKAVSIAIALFLILYYALTWIGTNVVGQLGIIWVYASLLIIGAAAYGFTLLKRPIEVLQKVPFGTIGMGSNLKVVALMTLIGLGIGYFLVSQHLTVALPLDVTYQQTVLNMDYVYKVIMSPSIEEIGVRAILLVSVALIVYKFSKNWLLALLAGLLISSLAFGIFHWLAYQQEFAFIGAAIIFGLIAGILMILSKSILPSIAFHFANNQLIFSEGDPTIVLVLGALVAAILAISFFRRWS